MIYLIRPVLCLNGSPSEDSFSNDSKCIWNVDIDPGNAAYSAHQIFMLELNPPPPFFLVGREKAKCWFQFHHCGTIFFFPQRKENSFILYPSLGCCHRVGDEHKREAKKSDSFGCITFYSRAKLYMGHGHGMPGPATLGQKKMSPPFHSPSQTKSFQSSPAALVIIRGASDSATWLKQSWLYLMCFISSSDLLYPPPSSSR